MFLINAKCLGFRYKERLASGVQREQALEQKRVQLELDWERRYEEVRAEHYLKCEELIKGLTESRDQVSQYVHYCMQMKW